MKPKKTLIDFVYVLARFNGDFSVSAESDPLLGGVSAVGKKKILASSMLSIPLWMETHPWSKPSQNFKKLTFARQVT